MRQTARYRAAYFLAGAATASVLGGAAVATTSRVFKYSAPQQGFFAINPAAMAPSDSAFADNYFVAFGYLSKHTRDSQPSCFVTGVNLPQGAKLRSVWSFAESGPEDDLQVILFRQSQKNEKPPKEIINKHYVENTGDYTVFKTDVPAALRVVDNSEFTYGFQVCLGFTTSFHGARINYTYTSAGD